MSSTESLLFLPSWVPIAASLRRHMFAFIHLLLNRFGWFGFNGCSVSYLVGQSSVAARAMVMTAISGGVSGLAGTLVAYLQADGRRQIDLSTTLNSILAGLVGITANCATVRLEGAFFIGIMSAVVYVFSVRLLNRYHIDDVVESVPVRRI